MTNKEIEKTIVKEINDLAKNDFSMNYDPTCKLDFQDALCYLISEKLENLDSIEIYDFLTTKLKQ